MRPSPDSLLHRAPTRILLALCVMLPVLVPPASSRAESIAAVVNGDVISQTDVDNREKLFALSTGLPVTPDVLARLRPQVTKQLIDEKLRLQEIQHRHIVVTDQEIASALSEIEQRNGLPAGGLRARLAAQGVAYRTLIDQIRVQIGWTRVLRQELGDKAHISDAEVQEQEKLLKAETGQPEYRVSEIFVPVDNPANAGDAHRFADTVIAQLRAGAAFPVVAAQFSQSQNALQGGDEGWVHAGDLDPAVADIITKMPPGAISNPIAVPGGLMIVTLRAKREVGRDLQTVLQLRQIFLPFSQPLNPQQPTEQQRQQLAQAQQYAHTLHSCTEMEDANKAAHSPRPANPGDVRLDQVNPPQFRAILAALPANQVSKPLVAPDGIGLVMICSRDTRNLGEANATEIREHLLAQRVELASRQLLRDLERRAVIHRPAGTTAAR